MFFLIVYILLSIGAILNCISRVIAVKGIVTYRKTAIKCIVTVSLSAIVGIACILCLLYMFEHPSKDASFWVGISVIFGFISLFALLIAWAICPNKESADLYYKHGGDPKAISAEIQQGNHERAIQNQVRAQQMEARNNRSSSAICPKCRSSNIQIINQDRKSFSAGKAIGGALLTGGIGLLAGFAGKKGDFQCHCLNCRNLFTIDKNAFK